MAFHKFHIMDSPACSVSLQVALLLLRESVHRLLCPESHFIPAPAGFAVSSLFCGVEVGLQVRVQGGTAQMGLWSLFALAPFPAMIKVLLKHLINVVYTKQGAPFGPR